MISLIWGRADQTNPAQDLDPCDFGWKTDESGMYIPLWNTGPVLPNQMGTTSRDTTEDGEALIDDQQPEWRVDSSDEDI